MSTFTITRKGDLKSSHNNVKIQNLRSVLKNRKRTHTYSAVPSAVLWIDRGKEKKLDSDVLTQKCIINPQTFFCSCTAQHQHHKSPRPPDHWECYGMASLHLYPIRIAGWAWWGSCSLSIWWSSESSTRLCFHLEWRNFTLRSSRACGDRLRNGQTGIKTHYAFNTNALCDACGILTHAGIADRKHCSTRLYRYSSGPDLFMFRWKHV